MSADKSDDVSTTPERRMYDALKRISKYTDAETLHLIAEKKYGLSGEEAIEMAYDNVRMDAFNAIRGMRRPK